MALFLASCATIFNNSHKRVDVVTSRPATIICLNNHDTIFGTEFSTWVKRGKDPLHLIVLSDSSRIAIADNSTLSFAWYANFFIAYGFPGILIDAFTPRRFTYSGYFYVDLEKEIPGEHKKHRRAVPSSWKHDRNAIKFSPLKLIAWANPGIEIGYERYLGERFGVQVQLAALAPPLTGGTLYSLTGKGVGIEPRIYFSPRICQRWFTGLETSWSHIRYTGTFLYAPKDAPVGINTHVSQLTGRVDRTIFQLTPKIGYQFTDGQFVGEISFGVGLKYRHVEHLDNPPGTEYFYYSRHPNVTPFIERGSNHMEVGTPASFMIGWRF